MMSTGSETRARQGETCLHPRSETARKACRIPQATRQMPQPVSCPYRDRVREAERLVARGRPLRPMPKSGLNGERARCNRHLLALKCNES